MEEYKGYVEHIIYRNEENTYTVFEVSCEDGLLTCTGYPLSISEGESCIVTGKTVQHAVYGEQLKVETYRVVPPEGEEAILRYLSSGAVKGIGQALAARIIKRFGSPRRTRSRPKPGSARSRSSAYGADCSIHFPRLWRKAAPIFPRRS